MLLRLRNIPLSLANWPGASPSASRSAAASSRDSRPSARRLRVSSTARASGLRNGRAGRVKRASGPWVTRPDMSVATSRATTASPARGSADRSGSAAPCASRVPGVTAIGTRSTGTAAADFGSARRISAVSVFSPYGSSARQGRRVRQGSLAGPGAPSQASIAVGGGVIRIDQSASARPLPRSSRRTLPARVLVRLQLPSDSLPKCGVSVVDRPASATSRTTRPGAPRRLVRLTCSTEPDGIVTAPCGSVRNTGAMRA